MSCWVHPEVDGEILPAHFTPDSKKPLQLCEVTPGMRIRAINLRGFGLKYSHAIEIAQFIRKTSSLKSLSLRDNDLDAEAAVALSDAIQVLLPSPLLSFSPLPSFSPPLTSPTLVLLSCPLLSFSSLSSFSPPFPYPFFVSLPSSPPSLWCSGSSERNIMRPKREQDRYASRPRPLVTLLQGLRERRRWRRCCKSTLC
uniref:Uncharacterized protein n=2 Tax=Guillardia theta TaxID=55529 RepID=A0A7S4KUP0_GUITH|mmetsp:Transcript_3149/g.10614  ORF Transcript_3149/g.10614 Transcript_3149/m.10614 type:complete len:198 (+) Transcript_3149:680-1273(+)